MAFCPGEWLYFDVQMGDNLDLHKEQGGKWQHREIWRPSPKIVHRRHNGSKVKLKIGIGNVVIFGVTMVVVSWSKVRNRSRCSCFLQI